MNLENMRKLRDNLQSLGYYVSLDTKPDTFWFMQNGDNWYFSTKECKELLKIGHVVSLSLFEQNHWKKL